MYYKPTGRTEKLTTYTRPEILDWVRKEAERESTTMSALVEHAVMFYRAVLDRMAEGERPRITEEVRQVEVREVKREEKKEENEEMPYADIFGE